MTVAVTTGTTAAPLFAYSIAGDSDSDGLADFCDVCDGGREFDVDSYGMVFLIGACEIRGNIFSDCSLDCSTTIITNSIPAIEGLKLHKWSNKQLVQIVMVNSILPLPVSTPSTPLRLFQTTMLCPVQLSHSRDQTNLYRHSMLSSAARILIAMEWETNVIYASGIYAQNMFIAQHSST